MKKNKLQKIIAKLKTGLEPLESVDQLESDITLLTRKLHRKVEAKSLDSVNETLNRFRNEIDLKPILNSLEELKSGTQGVYQELGDKLKGRADELFASAKNALLKLQEYQSWLDSQKNEINSLWANFEASGTTIKGMSDSQGSLKADLTSLGQSLNKLSKDLTDKIDLTGKGTGKVETGLLEVQDNLKKFRAEFLNLLGNIGGGAMNRQIKVAGVDVLTKYTDINLVAGTNVTITTANDNTDKNVDITINSTGGGDFVPYTGATANVDLGTKFLILGVEDGIGTLASLNATTNNSQGSNLQIYSGDGLGSGAAGSFTMTGGTGGITGDGGQFSLQGGEGGATSGAGGILELLGGNAGGTQGAGGTISFKGGTGYGTGVGGNIEFFTGIANGSGDDGVYKFYNLTQDIAGILSFSNIATSDKTFTFPNTTGTFALGTGTINEIAYWAGANTLGTLAVATYPSLTELTYVKGVTSAIQTQFTDKAATGQTFYIGTTQVAINRASAALTLAGITLTTPNIGTPSAGVATNITGLPAGSILAGTLVGALKAAVHGTAANPEIVNVCYGTGDPPAAASVPEGTIFIR